MSVICSTYSRESVVYSWHCSDKQLSHISLHWCHDIAERTLLDWFLFVLHFWRCFYYKNRATAKKNRFSQIFLESCSRYTSLRVVIFKHSFFPLLSLGYTFYTLVGSGHAQWACHSPYKVLSFSYSFRPDEVHSSEWKLVFNESTVLLQGKSTSTIHFDAY